MLNAVGIVAEYNPLHNGHLLHLNKTKSLLNMPAVIIMSGSIMQRGEPAFFDKWTRARLAVDNGADLVIELPCAFSLRSAQYFAQGAVSIMKAFGCISHLSCGAENPDTDFPAIAKFINSDAFQRSLKTNIMCGLSYASAYEKTLQEHNILQEALHSPNDILALEYSKALLHTDIKPVFIQRTAAQYNDLQIKDTIASASAIRNAFFSKNMPIIRKTVPENVWTLIEKTENTGYDQNLLWNLISYRLRILTTAQIAEQSLCSEGMENLLKRAASCTSLQEALQLCSGKRYPATRVRRLFMQLLFDKPAHYFDQAQPQYLRVLAFNNTGRQLLKLIKANNNLPIITKLGKNPFADQSESFIQQLSLDIAASDLLSLLQNSYTTGNDYITSPYYKK